MRGVRPPPRHPQDTKLPHTAYVVAVISLLSDYGTLPITSRVQARSASALKARSVIAFSLNMYIYVVSHLSKDSHHICIEKNLLRLTWDIGGIQIKMFENSTLVCHLLIKYIITGKVHERHVATITIIVPYFPNYLPQPSQGQRGGDSRYSCSFPTWKSWRWLKD